MFSVYLPSVNYTMDDYVISIDTLQALTDRFSREGKVMFLGDFNADLTKTDHRANILRHFACTNGLSVLPIENDEPTFRPAAKVLDHVLISISQSNLIVNNTVLCDDTCEVSDHNPILTTMRLTLSKYEQKRNLYIAWNICSNVDITNYSDLLSAYLQCLALQDFHANPNDIELLYAHIFACIKSAGKALPLNKYN